MLEYIVGLMAMVFGFVSLVIDNCAGAYYCFGFAFILWCVLSIQEYLCNKKGRV